MIRLTTLAQQAVARRLQIGDIAIDATAGNGHDTCFLAESIGPAGCVYAFDVQPEALQRTASRLETRELRNVVYCEADHADMLSVLPDELLGYVRAIMFNLGYLPGGDKRLTTSTSTTIRALSASVRLLQPRGVLTVLAYPGHPGGEDETRAVQEFLGTLDSAQFQNQTVLADSTSPRAPRLFIAARE
jgi:ubiquinone/menaquinone biosynthesis C-methylase UbiE